MAKLTTIPEVIGLSSALNDYALAGIVRQQYASLYRGVGATRSVITLRFDDGVSADYTVALPALKSRKLVAGFAIVSDNIGVAGYMTAAELLAVQDAGMEIMCHSKSHGTATDYTDSEFTAQTVGAAATIKAANNLHVQSFTPPAGWTGNLMFDSIADFGSSKGRILQTRFANADTYTGQAFQPIPAVPWGSGHLTLSDMTTAAQATAFVDTIVKYGHSCEFLCHTADLGTAGKLPSAAFTTFLDYLVTKVNAGVLTVLTPTAAYFADQNTAPHNYCTDPSFEVSATGALVGWYAVTGAATIVASGRTGTNALRMNDDNSVGFLLPKEGFRSVRVTAYAKADSATSAIAYLSVYDQAGATRLAAETSTTVTNAGWTKIVTTFGADANNAGQAFLVRLKAYSASKAYILWDDITIEKV